MLYLVTKTIEAYVQADSEREAKWVRIDEDGSDVTITAMPVESTRYVPSSWLNELPFRDESDKSKELTVGQLLTPDT